jgi:CheY-like chemotaxis protein
MNNTSRLPNQRILAIDDNEAIHQDFRKVFEASKQQGPGLIQTEALLFGEPSLGDDGPTFEIDSAFQGEDGLQRVRQALDEHRPYAMAFVDVRMPPGWDGIETISRVGKEYPDLQVVICTAYSDYSWNDILRRFGHHRPVGPPQEAL